MRSAVRFFTAAIALMLFAGAARASGPIAVYALIDSVSFEPNAEKPQRIRLTGVFITATERTDQYSAPQRGYLYFTLPGQNESLARSEWADLKTVAGTRQVVGIGSSWVGSARVRSSEEEPKSPDRYILGNGLVKVNPGHPRAKALLEFKDR
jgi:hypothetical protein